MAAKEKPTTPPPKPPEDSKQADNPKTMHQNKGWISKKPSQNFLKPEEPEEVTVEVKHIEVPQSVPVIVRQMPPKDIAEWEEKGADINNLDESLERAANRPQSTSLEDELEKYQELFLVLEMSFISLSVYMKDT